MGKYRLFSAGEQIGGIVTQAPDERTFEGDVVDVANSFKF
jgi:hypothetical protein